MQHEPNVRHGVFLQPYGFRSPGGGPRILRGLTEDSNYRILSIATSPIAPPACEAEEIHVPFRPHLGRIERSRFASLVTTLDRYWKASFSRRLEKQLDKLSPAFIHLVPHDSLDFDVGFELAQKKQIPCVVSVHDHPEYCFLRSKSKTEQIRCFANLWRNAQARTVISKELGESLDEMYGKQTWQIVTDGITSGLRESRQLNSSGLDVYFMGLMHHSYLPNLNAFCQALEDLRDGDLDVRFRLRCGSLPAQITKALPWLEVLPYADEATVESDMENSDLLYLPLPFTPEHKLFTDYSLSTKMVSYLPASRPIFFHGPHESAAGQILKNSAAALICDSCESQRVQQQLQRVVNDPEFVKSTIINAGNLAQSQFSLPKLRNRFWQEVDRTVSSSVLMNKAG